MVKYLLPVILIVLSLNEDAKAFDITGLQPTAPYSIFSTFSAESFPKGKAAFSTDAEILLDPDFYRFLFKSAYGITDSPRGRYARPLAPYGCGGRCATGSREVGFKHRI